MEKIAHWLVVGVCAVLLCGMVSASENVTLSTSENHYYFGEIIKFSGVNHASDTTHLYLRGPNLPPNGARLSMCAEVVSGNPASFDQAPVNPDGIWEYLWDSGLRNCKSDAGTYTIIANADPNGVQTIGTRNEMVGISLILGKPFAIVSASRSSVVKGINPPITITIEGRPLPTLAIWIIGDNYVDRETIAPTSTGTFSHEIDTAPATMTAGQYTVIVQHPMENRKLDVLDLGGLKGNAATEALMNAINAPDIDDTYSKIQFSIESPTTPTPDYSAKIAQLEEKVAAQETAIATLQKTPEPTTMIIEVTAPTPEPTITMNYEATIAAMQTKMAEQQTQIEEQGSWIDAILRFLGLK